MFFLKKKISNNFIFKGDDMGKKMLIVEDNRLESSFFKNFLSENGYEAATASCGQEALKKISEGFLPDLILMDIALEGEMDGIETAKKVLAQYEIPIIFLTGYSSKEMVDKMKSLGVYGFVLKGVDPYAILSSIDIALELFRKKNEITLYQDIYEFTLGETYMVDPETFAFLGANQAARKNLGYAWEEMKAMTIGDILPEYTMESLKEKIFSLAEGKENEIVLETIHKRKNKTTYPVELRLKLNTYMNNKILVVAAYDLTERKKTEEKLRFLSIIDPLTKAYNRRYMTQKLQEEIERARRHKTIFSIVMLDIDHFKKVNDCFGHNAGDIVLQSMVEMIQKRLRKIDVLARWGGEEFLILLPGTSLENAVSVAEELRERLSRMIIPDAKTVTASFGAAAFSDGDTVDTLVLRADNMMYKAKNEGRNCVRYS